MSIALLLTLSAARAQLPGEFPRLTLDDGQGQIVPAPAGPYDNSGVFDGRSGTGLAARLRYLAEGQPSSDVPWGLLVSASPTPFPTDVLPPPLFTLPPVVFLSSDAMFLDPDGEATQLLSIPAGLSDGELYVQALILDVTSTPALKLSNGVRVRIVPPRFSVEFTFARSGVGFGADDLEGVGSLELGPETLNTLFPLGEAPAPSPDVDDVGLPQGLRFLPIVPNHPDAPVNPLARPAATISATIGPSPGVDVFPVDDTSFFPSRGRLLVASEGSNLWALRTSDNTMPTVEVVTYTGKTPTSFTGVSRMQLGSTGATEFPHSPGDLVLGEYTLATTAAARSRSRVALDATNPDLPHVVVPSFTFDPGSGPVTMDLDVYLYETRGTPRQGFMVLDHVTREWRVIEGTELIANGGRAWDPMVTIAPDGRSMIACARVVGGGAWDDAADEVWAIRLDGLAWPASSSEAWQVGYETVPAIDLDNGASAVRSRRVETRSIAILNDAPGDFIAFVGLGYKFEPRDGTGVVTEVDDGPELAFEGAWAREEVSVRDYIDVPLATPGSDAPIPALPRPFITSSFGNVGSGAAVTRFDPAPLVSPDHASMIVAAGPAEGDEDVFLVRQVFVPSSGTTVRQILDLSGLGSGLGGEDSATLRAFDPGGHGWGSRAAFSPDGSFVVWLARQSVARDWIQMARTNGSDYGRVQNVYDDGNFLGGGAYAKRHSVSGLHVIDESRIVFLMGRSRYDDVFGENTGETPAYDVFLYDVSTGVMKNLTRTGGVDADFDEFGSIRPAATFLSRDGRFYYVVRGGPSSSGTAAGDEVMNVLAVDLEGESTTVFDITGDELGPGALVGNLTLPPDECRSPVETAAALRFTEGHGIQDGMVYLIAHDHAAGTDADELVAFHRDQPFVGFAATRDSPPGSHLSNVTVNPFSASVAFARTAGGDPLAADQHPFVVDLDNFLVQRDLTPLFTLGGAPIGRVMDGSFHFVPPNGEAPDGLVFSIGLDRQADTGVALRSVPFYYSLANVSDFAAEPLPELIPLVKTAGLGGAWRIYITSAGLPLADS